MTSGKRFFIAGYYGFGNVGDEAVVSVILQDIRTIDPDASFVLTAEREEQAKHLHPEVEATVSWRNTQEVIAAIRESDYVVIGGGGLWNSYFEYEEADPFERTDNYASHIYNVPILARLLDKPVIVYAVGGGHIAGEWPQKQAATALDCASLIMVRDLRTRAYFLSLGISENRIHVTADPAFRLAVMPGNDEVSRWAAANRPIAVVLRHWLEMPAGIHDTLAEELDILSAQLGRPLLFVPFDVGLHRDDRLSDDARLCRNIMSQLSRSKDARMLEGERNPEVISELLGAAALVISMRLHGNILAVARRRPLVGIAYDPKVRAVLEDLGLADHVLTLDEICTPGVLSGLSQRVVGAAEQMTRAWETAVEKSSRSVTLVRDFLAAPVLCPLPPAVEQLRGQLLIEAMTVGSHHRALVEKFGGLARNHVNAGEWALALPLLSILESAHPEDAEWIYLKSLTDLALGRDPAECLTGLDSALAKGYDPSWVLFNRAQCLLKMGRLDEAEDDLLEAASLNPGISEIATVQGWIDEARRRRT